LEHHRARANEPALDGAELLPKIYLETGKLTWQAELSMAAGVLGLSFLLWLLIATLEAESQQQTSLVPGIARWALLATARHLVFMGGAG